MKDEKLRDLYLNWKGLELVHSLKYLSRIMLITLSIIFIIVSVKINNTYILIASLVVLFLQILSENNKEYYLKYGEIFERLKHKKESKADRELIQFLEKVSGLNSVQKWVFGLYFNRKFKQARK